MTQPTLDTRALIDAYFRAFNAGDSEAMLALIAEDIEHHVNEGGIRRGRDAFRDFSAHMARCYSERLLGITVMVAENGRRAAAEFTVEGEYLATDEGLPEARGQRYTLPAGTFFAIENGRIARVTTYYNLREWVRQIGGEGDG